MSMRYSIAATAVLMMTGCTTTPIDRAAWMNYACSNGQNVQATYPDTNAAVIELQGKTHTLHVALSGSGTRYTGEGWQWWTKGMHDGTLAPLAPGESIAGAPGTTCHAN
ncbi:MliC family protein [Dyella acidisoli]|nr:MliC family protein [Dyella acidisoli]